MALACNSQPPAVNTKRDTHFPMNVQDVALRLHPPCTHLGFPQSPVKIQSHLDAPQDRGARPSSGPSEKSRDPVPSRASATRRREPPHPASCAVLEPHPD